MREPKGELVLCFRGPTIKGVKLREILKLCGKENGVKIEELARAFQFEHFLEREVNRGFSGGEIKKSELLQLLMQDLIW